MSYEKHQYLGALPAFGLSALALAMAGGLVALAVPEVFADPVEPEPVVAEATEAPAPKRTLAQVPAMEVLAATIGSDNVTWGAALPLPFGCDVPDGVVASVRSDGRSGVAALSAGQGAKSVADLASCGVRTTYAGAPAVSMGGVMAWSRGDVLVVSSTNQAGLDERLSDALAGVCHDVSPSVADARRNPHLGDYRPRTRGVQVTIEASKLDDPEAVELPDIEELPRERDFPEGLLGPLTPYPSPAVPQELTAPEEQVTSRELVVEITDTRGPGCGWDFAGTVAPVLDAEALAQTQEKAEEQARAELLADQEQWEEQAEEFFEELEGHLEEVAEWNAHVAEVAEAYASWDEQLGLLAEHEAQLASWQEQVEAAEEFEAELAAAREEYEQALVECEQLLEDAAAARDEAADEVAEDADGDTADPVPAENEPPVCEVAEPEIFEADPPEVADEPVAPELWTPAD